MSRVDQDNWITITDLRRHFHRILRDVERGSSVTIVRRGRAVARIVPVLPAEST